MTTDPTRAAEIVVRAEKAIALGKATGSDGSRLPSNIYVIAEELLALVQRPTDTARAVDELASYEKFDGVGPHAETIETRARIGERYLECYESALSDPRLKGYTPADCPSELLLYILHTWEPATPSPVTDEAAVSGEDRPDFSFHRVLREMRNGMTAHKWWRKVDGTPAQNDLPVIAANIAIRLLQEQRNG